MIFLVMIETLHLTVQLFSKIFSGFFLNGPSLLIVGLFTLAGLAFWAKAKLES
jgi:hypothetical protein